MDPCFKRRRPLGDSPGSRRPAEAPATFTEIKLPIISLQLFVCIYLGDFIPPQLSDCPSFVFQGSLETFNHEPTPQLLRLHFLPPIGPTSPNSWSVSGAPG